MPAQEEEKTGLASTSLVSDSGQLEVMGTVATWGMCPLQKELLLLCSSACEPYGKLYECCKILLFFMRHQKPGNKISHFLVLTTVFKILKHHMAKQNTFFKPHLIHELLVHIVESRLLSSLVQRFQLWLFIRNQWF